MEANLLALLGIVVAVLVLLWLLRKLGVDAEAERIIQIVIVGVALIVVFVRYFLPALGM